MAYNDDAITQFLICRCTARDRAVELCIAGEIKLEQIPEYTDKMTVIHFGGIRMTLDQDATKEGVVDAEIIRIYNKLTEDASAKAAPPKDAMPQDDGPPPEDTTDLSNDFTPPEEEPWGGGETEDTKVQCPTCLRMYANQKNLDTHIAKVHAIPKDKI